MHVLDLMKRDYKIDPDRIYLAGHSMGGGGALVSRATLSSGLGRDCFIRRRRRSRNNDGHETHPSIHRARRCRRYSFSRTIPIHGRRGETPWRGASIRRSAWGHSWRRRRSKPSGYVRLLRQTQEGAGSESDRPSVLRVTKYLARLTRAGELEILKLTAHLNPKSEISVGPA